MKRIGILGAASDPQAQAMIHLLEARGGHPLLLDTSKIPEARALSYERGQAFYEGQALGEIRVCYLRSIHLSFPTVDPGFFSERNFSIWQEQYIAERERHSLITSILRNLQSEGCLMINPVESFDLHFLKLHQLHRLQKAGVEIPASLGTCDPEALEPFAARYPSVICKPLGGGAMVRRLQEADHTPEMRARLKDCPFLFQEEILGREFRAYLLEGEPLQAFELPTEGVVDAREAIERVKPASLPPEVWDVCLRAARALGLIFTAVDLRITAEGRIVVFECNPTPAVGFFEDALQGVINPRLADFLLSKA